MCRYSVQTRFLLPEKEFYFSLIDRIYLTSDFYPSIIISEIKRQENVTESNSWWLRFRSNSVLNHTEEKETFGSFDVMDLNVALLVFIYCVVYVF